MFECWNLNFVFNVQSRFAWMIAWVTVGFVDNIRFFLFFLFCFIFGSWMELRPFNTLYTLHISKRVILKVLKLVDNQYHRIFSQIRFFFSSIFFFFHLSRFVWSEPKICFFSLLLFVINFDIGPKNWIPIRNIPFQYQVKHLVCLYIV